MKTFLAILVITVGLLTVSDASSTHISNWSTRQLRASVSYQYGSYDSVLVRDRLIEPYTTVVDEYCYCVGIVNVEIWVEGNSSHGWAVVFNNRSIVALDNGAAIDIFLVELGTLIEKEGPRLTTIFPWP